MSLNNRMYSALLLRKPSREGVAAALFGSKAISTTRPVAQANASAFFDAAEMSRATYDGGEMDLSPGAMSGVGGLGALPAATVYIPINHPGPPWDVGDAVFGISRGWGKVDGLAPGNLRVPNFEARYKKAQKVSAMADEFKVGTPIKNMGTQYDDRMGDALRRVLRHYQWDQVCGFGNDPEGAVWDNCRSKPQVDALKTALADVNNALKNYDGLEVAIIKAPPNWREDYIEAIDYGSFDAGSSAGSSGASSSGQSAYDLAFGNRSGGAQQSSMQQRSTATGGMPGWAPAVAGVALLGILAGGLYFTRKKG